MGQGADTAGCDLTPAAVGAGYQVADRYLIGTSRRGYLGAPALAHLTVPRPLPPQRACSAPRFGAYGTAQGRWYRLGTY
jgi:hypothetical protein